MNKTPDKVFKEIYDYVTKYFRGATNIHSGDYIQEKIDRITSIKNNSTYSGMVILKMLHVNIRRVLLNNCLSKESREYVMRTEGWEYIKVYWPEGYDLYKEINLKEYINNI